MNAPSYRPRLERLETRWLPGDTVFGALLAGAWGPALFAAGEAPAPTRRAVRDHLSGPATDRPALASSVAEEPATPDPFPKATTPAAPPAAESVRKESEALVA